MAQAASDMPQLPFPTRTDGAAPPAAAQAASVLPQPDISYRNEVQLAIDHGLLWLQTNQNSNGWWSTPDHPALTALAVSAFMGNPSSHAAARAGNGGAGYKFILDNVKPDGGIYHQDDENYNTSLCLMALIAAHKPEYDAVALRARQWIIGQQAAGKENTGSPFDGGVGYGSSATGPHTDMNNTYTALEALYYSKDLAKDKPIAGAKDLNWDAAIQFIQRCQNLPVCQQGIVGVGRPDEQGRLYLLSGPQFRRHTDQRRRARGLPVLRHDHLRRFSELHLRRPEAR